MADQTLRFDNNRTPVTGGLNSLGEIRPLLVDNIGSVSTAPSATSPESTEHDTILDAKTVTDAKVTVRVADHSVTPTLQYIGEAVAGSSEASAVWSIKRVDTSVGIKVLFADGNANFDNVWANRESLSYS